MIFVVNLLWGGGMEPEPVCQYLYLLKRNIRNNGENPLYLFKVDHFDIRLCYCIIIDQDIRDSSITTGKWIRNSFPIEGIFLGVHPTSFWTERISSQRGFFNLLLWTFNLTVESEIWMNLQQQYFTSLQPKITRQP